IPAPFTVYEKIYKLEPGHFLEFYPSGRKMIKERYYHPQRNTDRSMTYEKAYQQFDILFRESVKGRLAADVPVGAFLSGGIDSSLIVRYIRELFPDMDDFHTFSIGFNEKRYDESAFSEKVSDHYRTDHHHFYFSESDICDNIDMLGQFDEPFGDSSAMAVYFLAQKTRPHVKVVLSGDGADELFGGYRRYDMFRYHSIVRKIPYGIRKSMLTLAAKGDSFLVNGMRKLIQSTFSDNYYGRIMNNFSEEQLGLLFRGTSVEEYHARNEEDLFGRMIAESGGNLYERLMHCDTMSYLPYDILTKVDMMTMAGSLESRAPFLNRKIIDLAYSLPFSVRKNKKILKHGLRHFGRGFTHRNKKGFGVPLSDWFRGRLGSIMKEHIEADTGLMEFLDIGYVKGLLERHMKGSADNHYRLWQILVFIIWLKKDREYFL
ncbi:MAG: asparagine synthetase B family protein, partial [Candidatus Muiribacteriaceae bacterium]